MEKEYMVVAFGTSKKTNKPYSRAYCLRKDKLGKYGFLDQKDQYFTEDIRKLGEVLKVSQTVV
jgi:hypothetical protein